MRTVKPVCEESVHGVCSCEFGRDKKLEGIKKPLKKSDHKYQHHYGLFDVKGYNSSIKIVNTSYIAATHLSEFCFVPHHSCFDILKE